MKRFLPLLLVLLLLFSACAKKTDVPDGMVRASAEFADYDLFVPQEWKLDESGGAVSAYKSPDDPASVSVMAWGLPHADDTVADWWETYRAEFDTVFRNYTPVSEDNVLLDGAKATRYVYTASLGDYTYRYTQYAAVRNTSVYLMTFTELADTDHSEEFTKIAEAFRWK